MQSGFDIHPLREDYVLKEAGVLARYFRKTLARHILDEDGNVIDHPPPSYARVIDDDVWMEFVAQHQSEEFKVK